MIDKLIQTALAEEGYLEKKSAKDLDSKAGSNVGYNNYTKYARDMYGWVKGPYANGQPWCDTFVDWCFVRSFGLDKAKKLLGGWSAYTPTSAGYFKTMGQWHTSKPQRGDVIFFKNSERICHTGIVYKVQGNTVYTVEGNTSAGNDKVVANGGGVHTKAYNVNNSRIAGYGRPAYVSEEEGTDVDLKTLKLGSKGVGVFAAQCILQGYGYELGSLDSDFGKKTKQAVVKFQQRCNIDPDGIIGPATWRHLLGA